jgi:hypothetical protein
MSIKCHAVVASALLAALFMSGCKSSGDANSNSATQSASTNATKTTASPAKPNSDGTIPSGTGVEKEKPAAGTGNVQGRVLYNGQPAKDIEVKLCETFSQFVGGCGGQILVAKTDATGEYLIKNVPPKIYEGLTAKVFDTP